MMLTENALAAAIMEFKDGNGFPLKASKVVCGTRAQLVAKRILAPPTDGPFAGVQPSVAVEVDPRMGPDEWRVA